MNPKILKNPYFYSAKMAPKKVDNLLTFKGANPLTLWRPKCGQPSASPAYIYIYLYEKQSLYQQRFVKQIIASQLSCACPIYSSGSSGLSVLPARFRPVSDPISAQTIREKLLPTTVSALLRCSASFVRPISGRRFCVCLLTLATKTSLCD